MQKSTPIFFIAIVSAAKLSVSLFDFDLKSPYFGRLHKICNNLQQYQEWIPKVLFDNFCKPRVFSVVRGKGFWMFIWTYASRVLVVCAFWEWFDILLGIEVARPQWLTFYVPIRSLICLSILQCLWYLFENAQSFQHLLNWDSFSLASPPILLLDQSHGHELTLQRIKTIEVRMKIRIPCSSFFH